MTNEINIGKLAKMIKGKRGTRGLRAAADEIGGVSASTLSRVEQGKVPDLDTYIKLCKWLGVPADHFTQKDELNINKNELSIPDKVTAHLRADRTLDPQTVNALVTMIELAYSAVDRGQIGE